MNSQIIDSTVANEPGKVLHRTSDAGCILTLAGQQYLAQLGHIENRLQVLAEWHRDDGSDWEPGLPVPCDLEELADDGE